MTSESLKSLTIFSNKNVEESIFIKKFKTLIKKIYLRFILYNNLSKSSDAFSSRGREVHKLTYYTFYINNYPHKVILIQFVFLYRHRLATATQDHALTCTRWISSSWNEVALLNQFPCIRGACQNVLKNLRTSAAEQRCSRRRGRDAVQLNDTKLNQVGAILHTNDLSVVMSKNQLYILSLLCTLTQDF